MDQPFLDESMYDALKQKAVEQFSQKFTQEIARELFDGKIWPQMLLAKDRMLSDDKQERDHASKSLAHMFSLLAFEPGIE